MSKLRVPLATTAALAALAAVAGIAVSAADRVAPQPVLRVVCFGDSITGGVPRQPYLHHYIKYADLLELLLEGRLGLGRAAVLNRGMSGDRTYAVPSQGLPGAVARLKGDVLDEAPDVCVVLICGNDAKGTPEDAARTRKNLETVFSGIKRAGIRCLALGYHVLPNPESPETAWTHLDDTNPMIREVAAAHGFAYLDMGPIMREAAKGRPLAELVDPVDGVHLRPGGEVVYARAIYARLDALGWLPKPQTK